MTKKQNASSPKETADNTRKRKRVIPTRQPGAIINPIYSNPADDLFAEAFASKVASTASLDDAGHPGSKILDTQEDTNQTPSLQNTGHSAEHLLDTQQEELDAPSRVNTGHPAIEILDTFAPSPQHEAPSANKKSGAKTPSKKETGHSKNENWKQWEKSRSTVRVNLHIDKELDKKVRRYCIESEPRTELREFYERAAVLLLDTQSNEKLGANAPLDDRRLKTLYKTKPFIINLYLAYNSIFNPKSKWTVRDDEAGLSLNDVDLRIVELGILQTQANKNFSGKINSFGYYLPEIENFLELNMPEDALQVMLTINRRNWSNRTGKSVDLSFLKPE